MTTELAAYELPKPTKLHEQRTFSVRHDDGREAVVYAKAVTYTRWEIDRDSWFIFDAGWKFTGEVDRA